MISATALSLRNVNGRQAFFQIYSDRSRETDLSHTNIGSPEPIINLYRDIDASPDVDTTVLYQDLVWCPCRFCYRVIS